MKRVSVFFLAAVMAMGVFAGDGWTPSDCGLVVDLEPGDQILLSVMVDDDNNPSTPAKEFFVCDYPSYTGGHFGYGAANRLRLIPQDAAATKPSAVSVWTIDEPVSRANLKDGKDFPLGGLSYTMWSNRGYTLKTDGNGYLFKGDLTDKKNDIYLCDVIFAVPTVQSVQTPDPNNTLGKTLSASKTFNGSTGTGFLGMTYREVFMFESARKSDDPISYVNTATVTFNTTSGNKTWNSRTVAKGEAFYAYRENKHNATTRTLFRLYILNKPIQNGAGTYFFAYDKQDYKKYRLGPTAKTENGPAYGWTDSTAFKKVYTMDRLFPMKRDGSSKYYQTNLFNVPEHDNAYFYVGYNNDYRTTGERLGSGSAVSQFTKIGELPLQHMPGLKAPAGALGRMIVDTTSTDDNLGVVFRPAGVFLRTSSGVNIEMHPEPGDTSWICNEMWEITDKLAELQIKATLFTDSVFSETDPGHDIEGWSEMVTGTDVPVAGQDGVKVTGGMTGWARIYTNKNTTNGGMEFVLADADKYIHYNNNGLIGTQLPDQHPIAGKTTVAVLSPRLKNGFTFTGWNTAEDGSGTPYKEGDLIDLSASEDGKLTLYAQGSFNHPISIALSFVEGGKRYFVTHPGTAAPRFARARRFDDWTNTWQGMANAENIDPHYLTTYLILGKNTGCAKCEEEDNGEYVFDPKRETVYGAKDSVTFYKNFMPAKDEYVGLYYTEPNTMLANTTWAGIFKSTQGWPSYLLPSVDSTKLYSTHYFNKDEKGEIQRNERTNSSAPYIKYDPATNQFNGVPTAEEATTFQITGVVVADEHFVILPDTTDSTEEWKDEIVFDYHEGEHREEQIWSKLIGKQLMICIKVGNDTVYFHPNEDKTKTTASDLRLSPDYRLTETFTYIPDKRVSGMSFITDEYTPIVTETANDFDRMVISGLNSPITEAPCGIDMCDTLRITLRPASTSKIKDYYGRWKKGAPGLHINADGSRYRDIIIRTKIYHYGETETKLVLQPEQEEYALSPLKNHNEVVTFKLLKATSRPLMDAEGHIIHEDILSSEEVTSPLALAASYCSLKKGGSSDFEIVGGDATTGDHVTVKTKNDNNDPTINYDTLTVTIPSVTVEGDTYYSISARVPVMQSTLEGNELVWSVVHNGQRYFIMADSETDGLVCRRFTERTSGGKTALYQKDTWTNLRIGTTTDTHKNTDARYLTPWYFEYVKGNDQQVTLQALYGLDKFFVVNSGTTPATGTSSPAALTYEYVAKHVNTNANFEEEVRLKYGDSQWLKFNGSALVLTSEKAQADTFSFGYLQREYSLQNNGAYPSLERTAFGYNRTAPVVIQTLYQGYKEYSMLLGDKLTYCGREDEKTVANLVDPDKEWKTDTAFTIIPDSRTTARSGLSITNRSSDLKITITPSGDSPTGMTDIVDTLDVRIRLRDGAPAYRFKEAWSGFTSIEDARLKIPLVRKAYHTVQYDSVFCAVEGDEHNFSFPATLTAKDSLHTFTLGTYRHKGTNYLDSDNQVEGYDPTSEDTITDKMDLDSAALAEVRLIDEFGNTPDWCRIESLGDNTVTVRCLANGIRTPRRAFLYFAYIVTVKNDKDQDVYRYVNFRLAVSQSSRFEYGTNQTLTHSTGASGDPLLDGRQQVHENKRILYYYNPDGAASRNDIDKLDQKVELPVRERGFYGWWRWFREDKDVNNNDVSDTDVPDSLWIDPPLNTGRHFFPFRIIGDSVDDGAGGKKWVTQGRYTVFHYPSKEYNRSDPPAKNPTIVPPMDKKTLTYAVEISNYYDHLPLSMKNVNQIDTTALDTMHTIIEPTLSLREVFELHPWTEMAAKLEGYKSAVADTYENERYMEDHTVMAPLGNRLLLSTEQRYNYKNIQATKQSESLLGYYMRDDNWSTGEWTEARKDTMIWCGGWDSECKWYTYSTKTKTYSPCTYSITTHDDFLNVPAKNYISAGQEADTVIYCLRARSWKTTGKPGDDEKTEEGDYWFNICRYTVIYHHPDQYGPKKEEETAGKTATIAKAIITNDEIDQNYEVLERLNFDYNQPGPDYAVYDHPLPWKDASYGFSYPMTPEIPDNRYHNDFAKNFANMGEYNLLNRIPYGNYWHLMEQHGGAENGYMIYCDGMASAGQVAALSLETALCEGQKMYFSAFVGNPAKQSSDVPKPNFVFSVQGSENGSEDGAVWEDITEYMTGDIQPSEKWYQIFFPIRYDAESKKYTDFRVRVYNMASDNNGNDFVIDDMCLFATKPPLMVYQANTACREETENDSITHVVLRLDYQGFEDPGSYNNQDVCYTIESLAEDTFISLVDGYYNEKTRTATDGNKVTIYGEIPMPAQDYIPTNSDSIYVNLQELINKFVVSLAEHKKTPATTPVVREGYVFENLDGAVRPVLYIVHSANMAPDKTYKVHLAQTVGELLSSKCGMTSTLKVKNRMVLRVNGQEQVKPETADLCTNTSYDLSLLVKGTLLRDSVAPLDINGSCINDWLLYGDTSDVTSPATYGYKYSDIVKVIRDILRFDPEDGIVYHRNINRFAGSLGAINSKELTVIQKKQNISLPASPYKIISDLVKKGFLILYRSDINISMTEKNDTVHCVAFPIRETGSDELLKMDVEVCPTPVFITLTTPKGGDVPITVGGFGHNEKTLVEPSVILTDTRAATREIAVPIDSINKDLALSQVVFLSTNDPNFRPAIHRLQLVPDRTYDNQATSADELYYKNRDTLFLAPANTNNYTMQPGYSYTFELVMTSRMTGKDIFDEDKCPIGVVPFTIAVVPDYMRWDPQGEDMRWNNPDNWIGINLQNQPIHADARFAPQPNTQVVIPPTAEGVPYPVLTGTATPAKADSVYQTHFRYNVCDSIRFMQGAAIGNQQFLEYKDAIVDLTIPQQKWALRSAPVLGMLSGDIFMSEADLNRHTSPWEVGAFDAEARNYRYGNATFWLSLYNTDTYHQTHNGQDATYTAAAEWSKVTNGLDLSLPPAQGWAVYAHTKSDKEAVVRLPKKDDKYYYFYTTGGRVDNQYVQNLQARRTAEAVTAGGTGSVAGRLAFAPGAEKYKDYTLGNESSASNAFVFGNPTMGYIDLWGFIGDNTTLAEEITYLNPEGTPVTVTKKALESTDTITSLDRYLPPMHAVILKKKDGATATTLAVRLNTSRIVTKAPKPAPEPEDTPAQAAPARRAATSKGIMTVTANNPVSPRCTSRLLLGEGFHEEVMQGEDALLMTFNIDHYTNNTMPATPFNLYAAEGEYGLCIDLRNRIESVPVSFYNSDLPFDPVTHLWFTGVHNISGSLVLYDAKTGTERDIIDGVRLDIETPEQNHEIRYYICRPGYKPGGTNDNPVTTGIYSPSTEETEAPVKIIKDDQVMIIRDGHVYTVFGQKVK